MRVIFLDVDGVLNCRDHWGDCEAGKSHSGDRLYVPAVKRLIRLVQESQSRIVVSSTWRLYYYEALIKRLEMHGMPPGTVIGKTPRLLAPKMSLDSPPRGHEIRAWLAEHPEVTSFIILDDDRDMQPYHSYLVKTEWKDGLLDSHVDYALRKFATGRAAFTAADREFTKTRLDSAGGTCEDVVTDCEAQSVPERPGVTGD